MVQSPGPALAMLLLGEIPPGLRVLDALAKEAEVEVLQTGTIHCGRYLILFGGEVGPGERSWRRALETAGSHVVDEVLLPHAEARLAPAIRTGVIRWPAPGDTLGVLQATTPPTLVRAVDAALKGALVDLVELRVGDGLGGDAIASLWAGAARGARGGGGGESGAASRPRARAPPLLGRGGGRRAPRQRSSRGPIRPS